MAASSYHILDLINIAWKDLRLVDAYFPSWPRSVFSGEQSVSVPWETATALESATWFYLLWN